MKVHETKLEQNVRLVRITKNSLEDLETLSNNEFMSHETFRLMLKTNKNMKIRFDILQNRLEQLKRNIWKLPN